MLNESQRRRYQEDGIVFPLPVLSAEEARRFRAECDSLEAHLGGRPRAVEVRQMHLHFRWAYELVVHPRVLDAVAAVLGPDLLVWATELFAKHPQDSAVSIGWHRDKPYMGFDASLTTTAWIALGPSTPANGCMKVLMEPDRHSQPAAAGAMPPEDQATDVVLQAGEMSLHDPHVLHGSGANLSEEKRVGFAVRYITPQARPLAGRPRVILARGGDELGHFEHAMPPEDVGSEEALHGLKNSAAAHLDAILTNLKLVGSSR